MGAKLGVTSRSVPPHPAQPRDTGQLPWLLRQIAVSPPPCCVCRARAVRACDSSGPPGGGRERGPLLAPLWSHADASMESCPRTCGIVRTAEGLVTVALLGCGLLAGAVPVAAEALGLEERGLWPLLHALALNERRREGVSN